MTVEDNYPLSDLAPLAPLTPPVGGRKRRPGPWHARWWEAMAISLPALLMGALALGTWWLVKNTPLPDVEGPSAPPRHVPDYEMQHFSLQRFTPAGSPSALIEGQTLRHYPDTDTLEIDSVRVRSVDPNGLVSNASARQALANGDLSEVQLVGDARVVRRASPGGRGEDGFEFRGEFLHIDTDTERVRSHLPVTLVSGGAEIRADSLDYDHLSQVAKLSGRVRGSITPRR